MLAFGNIAKVREYGGRVIVEFFMIIGCKSGIFPSYFKILPFNLANLDLRPSAEVNWKSKISFEFDALLPKLN